MKKERTLLASEELDLQFHYQWPYKARVTYHIIEIDKIEADLVIFNGIDGVRVYKISIFTSTLNESIEEVRRAIGKGQP